MTLTSTDIQSIKNALKPEFDQVHAEAKHNFTVLTKKIESLTRSNRKNHNLIIKVFDEKYHDLKDRVKKLEEKSIFPPFKNLWYNTLPEGP